jgi:hypothetical protein
VGDWSFGTIRRALGADEGRQIENTRGAPENGKRDGVGDDLLVGPSTSHLAEEVDVPEVGRQREVQSAAYGVGVEVEGQPSLPRPLSSTAAWGLVSTKSV